MTEKEKLEKEIANIISRTVPKENPDGWTPPIANIWITINDIADFILSRDKKRNGEAITIDALKTNPAYSHIDIDAELNKARQWIARQSGRKLTPKFFVAWLNRIERPLEASPVNKNVVKEAF